MSINVDGSPDDVVKKLGLKRVRTKRFTAQDVRRHALRVLATIAASTRTNDGACSTTRSRSTASDAAADEVQALPSPIEQPHLGRTREFCSTKCRVCHHRYGSPCHAPVDQWSSTKRAVHGGRSLTFDDIRYWRARR